MRLPPLTGTTAGRGCGGAEVAAGLLVVAASVLPVLRADPPPWELQAFHALNDLPDAIHRPVWVVMQLGALGAAPATAAAALALGDRRLARRLVVRGAAVWLAAKAAKRLVGRGRPAAVVVGTRLRGRSEAGDGYPSGHAGVATALAASAMSAAAPGARPLLAGLAAAVGAARVYVGAHLPLDVAGGAGLGLVVDGALGLVWPRW